MAAEGAILNEMLEIVAKRAALRPNTNAAECSSNNMSGTAIITTSGSSAMPPGGVATTDAVVTDSIALKTTRQSNDIDESDVSRVNRFCRFTRIFISFMSVSVALMLVILNYFYETILCH